MTLSATSCTYEVGSADITINWTPSGMPESPHTNYVYVTKVGPINIYSGTKTNCRNGVSTNLMATLSETVQYSTDYLILINYSNA
jgi:hypothetical protein